MKRAIVLQLTDSFEAHAQLTENGIEYWLARDLQHLLGYGKWDNFLNVISKAKTACEVAGNEISDHFAGVGKMVDLGCGGHREIDDIMSPELAEQKQIEAYRSMSGEQRLSIGLQLHELSCEIARESIRARFPNANAPEVERLLRDRIRLAYEIASKWSSIE